MDENLTNLNLMRPTSPEGFEKHSCNHCGLESYHQVEDCPGCGKTYESGNTY